MVTQTRTNCTERAVQTEMMDTHMFVQTDHITTLSTGVQTDKITIDVTPLHATEIKAKEKFDIVSHIVVNINHYQHFVSNKLLEDEFEKKYTIDVKIRLIIENYNT